jgi:hypothetical protein
LVESVKTKFRQRLKTLQNLTLRDFWDGVFPTSFKRTPRCPNAVSCGPWGLLRFSAESHAKDVAHGPKLPFDGSLECCDAARRTRRSCIMQNFFWLKSRCANLATARFSLRNDPAGRHSIPSNICKHMRALPMPTLMQGIMTSIAQGA